MRRRFGLRAKLTGIMLLVVIVTVASVGTLAVSQSRPLILSGIQESANNKVEATVEQIEGWLQGVAATVDTLAVSHAVRTYDKEKLESELTSLLKRHSALSNVYAASEAGQMLVWEKKGQAVQRVQIPSDYDPRTRPWYQAARNERKVAISPVYRDATTNEWVTTISAPVYDANGTLAGVVGTDITLADLTAMVAAVKMGQSGYAFLVDNNGVFLAHPDKQLLATKITELDGDVAAIGKRMLAGSNGHETVTFQGEARQMVYRSIPLVKWSLGVTIATAEVEAPLVKLLYWVVLIGVIALAVAGALVYAVSRHITRPILQVNAQLEAIARGGGDLTQRLAITSHDEVGDLARWFNAFLEKLADLIREVGQAAVDVKEGTGQLSASMQQQTQVTTQMAGMVGEVAHGAQEQSAMLSQTRAAMDALAAAISQIAQGAQSQVSTVEGTQTLSLQMEQEVKRAVNHTATLGHVIKANLTSAGRGNEAVQAVVASMQALRQGTDETTARVSRLDDGSRQIGAIVQVISTLADQTNMLALNAAIEAARAGEHGRGFAVVAEEVRTLAERSRKSAGEIAQIVESLGGAISSTVEAVQTAGQQVEQCERVALQAGESLHAIEREAAAAQASTADLQALAEELLRRSRAVGEAMTHLAAVSEQTTALTEEMASGRDQVVQAVARMATISQETAAGAQEGAAAAEELSATLEEVSATSDSLAGSAHTLQSLVQRFKV